MTESIWQFIPYLFSLVFAASIIEIILSARWSPLYFTAGIAIYRRTMLAEPGVCQLPAPEQIEAFLPPCGRKAPMLVRRINGERLIFREKLFHFGIGYSPVMHGCMIYDPRRGEIQIRGYLNWYILLFACSFILYLLISPPDPANIIIPLCMAVLLAYIYWMQKKRFTEVEEVVLKLWGMSRAD